MPYTYTFKPTNRGVLLSKLMDELIATIPALQPVLRADGYNEAAFSLDALPDGDIRLELPLSVATTVVQAVLEKHDPAPKPPQKDDYEILRNALTDANTIPQMKAALLAFAGARIGRNVVRP